MVGRSWLLMVVIAPQWQRQTTWKGAAFQAPMKPVPISSTGRILSQSIVSSPRLWNDHCDTPNDGLFGIRQKNWIGTSATLAASSGVVATSARLPTPIPTSDVALTALSRLNPVLAILWATLKALVQTIAPSRMELVLFGRISAAAVVGMAIGYERRTSNRPAGVRTMSLVAIGACIFTVVSQVGFSGSDNSRVAASVASGVGFIGAGVITTAGKGNLARQSPTDIDGDVRGLTTASAIWITAGLGMACGTGLLFTAAVGAALTVAVLKISRVQQTVTSKFYRLWVVLSPRSTQNAASTPPPAAVASAGMSDGQPVFSAKASSSYDGLGESETADKKERMDRESREELYADMEEMATARRVLQANSLDALRRAMDPDDDTLPPLEGMGEEGEDEHSERNDVGDIRDMYHDDPFFGGTWPGVLAKAKPWVPDSSAPPPAPIKTIRKQSRVIPPRKRPPHLRRRGLRVVRPSTSSVAERPPPDKDSIATNRGVKEKHSIDIILGTIGGSNGEISDTVP